jgi:hypothetical protein
MACPFFKKAYAGLCSACDFPYTPSTDEMEHLCFKASFVSCVSCVYFNNLHATAQIAPGYSVDKNVHDVYNTQKLDRAI